MAMKREEIKNLALNLMFNMSDEEADDTVKEFETFERQLAVFENIDTSGVEEMIYPFDVETTYLREDEVTHQITSEEALENAPKKREGHFVVPKVVK